jgi:Xaa-Pro aminopeptidase
MFDLPAVQAALREENVDGWLLYDFRGLNVLARRIAQMPEGKMLSRRWFYFVPATGQPKKLVHRIESGALDHLPGDKTVYLRWQELETGVAGLVQGAKRLAMEYVARNSNPYVSRVDAGTVELVRSCGPEIVPSGDLIQRFEACWDDEQWAMHQQAARYTRSAFDAAFGFISQRLRAGNPPRETEVVQVILDHFKANRVVCDHAPICAVGPNSGNPHYEPMAGQDALVTKDSFVLVDLWAKCDKPRAVYSDLTRTAFAGKEVPAKVREVFTIVAQARDAAIAKVRSAFAQGTPLHGWEVDNAARAVIEKAGYGEAYCHRTGHSIGQEVHGNGANMDGLETREDRKVLRRTCFSIEPGIYLKEFGIRSEVDVFVDGEGKVHVTGGEPQTEVPALLVG